MIEVGASGRPMPVRLRDKISETGKQRLSLIQMGLSWNATLDELTGLVCGLSQGGVASAVRVFDILEKHNMAGNFFFVPSVPDMPAGVEYRLPLHLIVLYYPCLLKDIEDMDSMGILPDTTLLAERVALLPKTDDDIRVEDERVFARLFGWRDLLTYCRSHGVDAVGRRRLYRRMWWGGAPEERSAGDGYYLIAAKYLRRSSDVITEEDLKQLDWMHGVWPMMTVADEKIFRTAFAALQKSGFLKDALWLHYFERHPGIFHAWCMRTDKNKVTRCKSLPALQSSCVRQFLQSAETNVVFQARFAFFVSIQSNRAWRNSLDSVFDPLCAVGQSAETESGPQWPAEAWEQLADLARWFGRFGSMPSAFFQLKIAGEKLSAMHDFASVMQAYEDALNKQDIDLGKTLYRSCEWVEQVKNFSLNASTGRILVFNRTWGALLASGAVVPEPKIVLICLSCCLEMKMDAPVSPAAAGAAACAGGDVAGRIVRVSVASSGEAKPASGQLKELLTHLWQDYIYVGNVLAMAANLLRRPEIATRLSGVGKYLHALPTALFRYDVLHAAAAQCRRLDVLRILGRRYRYMTRYSGSLSVQRGARLELLGGLLLETQSDSLRRLLQQIISYVTPDVSGMEIFKTVHESPAGADGSGRRPPCAGAGEATRVRASSKLGASGAFVCVAEDSEGDDAVDTGDVVIDGVDDTSAQWVMRVQGDTPEAGSPVRPGSGLASPVPLSKRIPDTRPPPQDSDEVRAIVLAGLQKLSVTGSPDAADMTAGVVCAGDAPPASPAPTRNP